MIFALDMDDGRVLAFASEDEAVAHCKPVDVQDGYWRFYDDDGSPLEPRFPAVPGESAPVPRAFWLERAMSGLWLQERLEKVTQVSGGDINSLDALSGTLKANRARRVARDRLRR
ncbi:MAG TPA: hypothetical protein VEC19_15485 [Usitatibacter sp.]|nr:hypothetical protein [Usitatibacter sp.]